MPCMQHEVIWFIAFGDGHFDILLFQSLSFVKRFPFPLLQTCVWRELGQALLGLLSFWKRQNPGILTFYSHLSQPFNI